MADGPDLLDILKAQNGDLGAFDRVLQAVEGPLFRYLERLTGDREAAKDLLQESFLLIFRKIGGLREPLFFRAWAFRLASREAFRFLKKQKKASLESIENASETAFFDFETAENESFEPLLERLPELLDGLSPAARAVVWLHFFEKMKLAEVADALEIPLGTVKSRLGYGLAALRKMVFEKNFDA